MKEAYPVVITKENDGYFASIPDFNIDTQGTSVVNAIAMARDAIGLMGIDLEDDGKEIPKPNSVKVQVGENYTVTLVDVDFTQYYRKVDNRAVKKNCTISYWLNVEAEKSGINFSKVLQEALMQ
ncbi:MAG TPA: type II toxin-antitoxin system HicB family antitoxin [Acetivibrio sp.]|nr:type II toxin-antitoxin system HicB family antitoxin [Acetivibrio sp.]HPT91955.1 type II toxin-antitoxin system HicB family antitoxin [Acetivibrio sp.]